MNRSPLNYLKSFIEQFKKSWRSSRNNPNDIVEIKERIRNPSPYNTWSYLPFLPQIGLILILKICFGIILLLCVSLGIIHLVTPYIEHGRDIVHDFFMSGIFPSWLVEHFQKQRPKPFEYVGHAFITTLSWATLALFGFKIRIYLPKNIGKYILPFSSNPHIPILSPICGFYSLVLLWFFLVIIFSWNEFMFALMLAPRVAKTLPTATVGLLGFGSIHWAVISAAVTIMSIPLIIYFLVVQNKMVKGLALGAV